MYSVVASLVAVFAQWDTSEMKALFYMMGVAWAECAANSAWQRLYHAEIPAVVFIEVLAVHAVLVSRFLPTLMRCFYLCQAVLPHLKAGFYFHLIQAASCFGTRFFLALMIPVSLSLAEMRLSA
jgi:hypothetical protein